MKMPPNTSSIGIEAIDDVIHGRLRLGIMAYLSAVNPVSFPELLEKTGTSNGNLSTHLTKLEAAGYVSQEKGYAGKKPQTLVHLTDSGRTAWIAYLEAMRFLLDG
jgi:DNA-binding MarR family transcriptional regulator|tara:strand:+ start:996 stop:1310 length:315 start_codon:yes stop_codon:yes gene_type:complete